VIRLARGIDPYRCEIIIALVVMLIAFPFAGLFAQTPVSGQPARRILRVTALPSNVNGYTGQKGDILYNTTDDVLYLCTLQDVSPTPATWTALGGGAAVWPYLELDASNDPLTGTLEITPDGSGVPAVTITPPLGGQAIQANGYMIVQPSASDAPLTIKSGAGATVVQIDANGYVQTPTTISDYLTVVPDAILSSALTVTPAAGGTAASFRGEGTTTYDGFFEVITSVAFDQMYNYIWNTANDGIGDLTIGVGAGNSASPTGTAYLQFGKDVTGLNDKYWREGFVLGGDSYTIDYSSDGGVSWSTPLSLSSLGVDAPLVVLDYMTIEPDAGASPALTVTQSTGGLGINVGKGSAAYPAITGGTDTDTGWYWDSTDNQLGLSIGGTAEWLATSTVFSPAAAGGGALGSQTLPWSELTTAGVIRSYISGQSGTTNYETLTITPATGNMTIAAETAGTGADNVNITLTSAGTGNIYLKNGTATTGAYVSPAQFRIEGSRALSLEKTGGTVYRVDRHFSSSSGDTKNLTAATPTGFVRLDTSAGPNGMTSGQIRYSIEASDGTDFQSRGGELWFSVINKGGTPEINLVQQGTETFIDSQAVDGTLTNSFTATVSGNNITILADAASSLSETTLRIRYFVEITNINEYMVVTGL
jgi:hypothetical protein